MQSTVIVFYKTKTFTKTKQTVKNLFINMYLTAVKNIKAVPS